MRTIAFSVFVLLAVAGCNTVSQVPDVVSETELQVEKHAYVEESREERLAMLKKTHPELAAILSDARWEHKGSSLIRSGISKCKRYRHGKEMSC